MRTEDALNQLLAAVKEGEDQRDILLMNSPSFLRPENLGQSNLD